MRLILKKTNSLIKGNGTKYRYISKKDHPQQPQGAEDAGQTWKIPVGAAVKTKAADGEDIENGGEKTEDSKDKDKGKESELPEDQPTEKVKVAPSTSTKEVAPQITSQTGLQSKNKAGWRVRDEDHKDVINRNKADPRFESSIEMVPIDSINLPDPRDKGRTASVSEGMDKDAEMPPARLGEKDGKWEVSDGVHRINEAKKRGATHVPALIERLKGESSKAPSIKHKDFNNEEVANAFKTVAEKMAKDGPKAFTAAQHKKIAAAAEAAGNKELAKQHKKYADELSAESKKSKLVETVNKQGAEGKPKPAKSDKDSAKIDTKAAAAAAKKADYESSIDRVGKYLDGLKSKVEPGSKEEKLIEEYTNLLKQSKGQEPSTVSAYDLKSAYNLSNQIRQKVAANETSQEKEFAEKLADRMDHEMRVSEVSTRIAKELSNTVDPAAKKILETHLERLDKQARGDYEGVLDDKDLAEAERDVRSIAKKNIKDKAAAPEKQAKNAEKEKTKQERVEAKQAREKEKSQKQEAKDKATAFKAEQHKKDSAKLRSDIQQALSSNGKNIDPKDFKELYQHFQNLDSHSNISQVSGKESVELSQAKSALNKVNKKVDSKLKKEQAQAQAQNKKLTVQNTKIAEHKQHIKDTSKHVESAISALPDNHPMKAELEGHLAKIKAQTPEGLGFTKAHKKELMEAWSAASKAHRESNKPAKAEKETKAEKKTFFTESKPTETKKPGVSVSNSASRGRSFGSRASQATDREEAAPTADVAADTALSGFSSLFSGNKTPKKESTISSKKETVKDDTKKKEVKKSFTVVPDEVEDIVSICKSITGWNYIPAQDSFEKHIGGKVTKLTGRMRDEYNSFLTKSLLKSIEGLDVE